MSPGFSDRRRIRREERALVRRMMAGDEAAFEEFCDDYVPVMYRFVQRRLGGNREPTREIVQTVLSKVLAKLHTFRGEAGLATWLCACCRNEIAAHYRRGGRSIREVPLESEEVAAEPGLGPHEPSGPERSLLAKECAERVHAALDALPPRYGRALEWKYLENLSVKEIAARLGLGPKAAESLLTRARKAFRDRYARLARGARTPVRKTTLNPRRTAVEL